MILSKGKNQFKDNRFSFWEWSAPILQTGEEVIRRFHELNLKGRVVKDIIAIGMGYNWVGDWIDDAVYNAMERMTPSEKAAIPNPDAFLPEGVELLCFAEIDEPILIVFEDGDVLGISFDEGSCVRMDLNTLPVTLEWGTNRRTFHANRLFRDILGKSMTGIEVEISTCCPEFTGSYGLHLKEQESYIQSLSFIYRGEPPYRYHSLNLQPFYDYGHVELRDWDKTPLTIPAKDVPWVVEGYLEFESEGE